jgi:hypothetical protein
MRRKIQREREREREREGGLRYYSYLPCCSSIYIEREREREPLSEAALELHVRVRVYA